MLKVDQWITHRMFAWIEFIEGQSDLSRRSEDSHNFEELASSEGTMNHLTGTN